MQLVLVTQIAAARYSTSAMQSCKHAKLHSSVDDFRLIDWLNFMFFFNYEKQINYDVP